MSEDMNRLIEAQKLASQLSRTKLACLIKVCLLRLGEHGGEYITLGELDSITDTDPELD